MGWGRDRPVERSHRLLRARLQTPVLKATEAARAGKCVIEADLSAFGRCLAVRCLPGGQACHARSPKQGRIVMD